MGRYELKLKRKQKQKQNVDNKIRTRATITKRKTNYRTETTPYHFYDLRSRRSCQTDNSTVLPPESCCSTNLTPLNSTEFLQNSVTTPESTADNLEVESEGESSSKFTDSNKLSREIDGVDSTAMKSTVEIKPMTMIMTSMIPSQFEIDDFFASAEKDLQKRFCDKYNFDILKDAPLEGRYEWVQVKP